jgi:transcriptional regulator with XRE-family HTH domain
MTTKERLSFLINQGFTIASFARRVECDKTTLGRWLRGETNLSARLERDVKKEINQLLQELDSIKEENYGINLSEDKP